ncbi:hypothetical protein C2E31_18735 [Rhodopirellula baltica]|nr:hypothetical protein C2E31_18735 [Rhodopirellula baltica]
MFRWVARVRERGEASLDGMVSARLKGEEVAKVAKPGSSCMLIQDLNVRPILWGRPRQCVARHKLIPTRDVSESHFNCA